MVLLGSGGKVVELDESCFKRKHNKSRQRKTYWVFGLIERGGGFMRSVFIPVIDRSANTLIPEAALVVSDSWRAYSTLAAKGFQYKQVNHSLNFVVPQRQSANNPHKKSQKEQAFSSQRSSYPHIDSGKLLESFERQNQKETWEKIKPKFCLV